MNSDNNEVKQDSVSKQCIFKIIATEAAGLYNLLITVSTGMLAGTLLFLEKIAPSPTTSSLLFLGLGWLMLLFCTLACAWIRWNNLESGRLALEGKFEDARKVDNPNRMLTKLSIMSLGLGIALIGIFAMVNILNKVNSIERNIKMVAENAESKNKEYKEHVEKKAIPFSSINPPEEAEHIPNNQDSDGDANGEVPDDSE